MVRLSFETSEKVPHRRLRLRKHPPVKQQMPVPASLEEVIEHIGEDSLSRDLKLQKGDNVLVIGQVQAGKTGFALNTALRLKYQRTIGTILLVRNMNVDVSQFCAAVHRNFLNIAEAFAGRSPPNFPMARTLKSCTDADLVRAHVEPGSVLLIGHANPSTISSLNEFYENHPEHKGRLVLILDESDLNLLFCDRSESTKTEVYLNELVRSAFATVQTTATYLPSFAGKKVTQVHALLPMVREGRRYFGIDDVVYVPIARELRRKRQGRGKWGQSSFAAEDNGEGLHQFLADMLDFQRRYSWSVGLINTERITTEHDDLARWIIDQPPYRDKICVVKLHRSKIFVRHTTHRHLEGFEEYTLEKDNNLNTVLRHLRQTGETVVVIIAGAMAGRCLNFTCTEYLWHLTHMFLSVPATTSGETLIQMQRTLGIFPEDRPPPRLFCSPDLWDDIRREFRRLDRMQRFIMSQDLKNLWEILDPENIADPVRQRKFIAYLDNHDNFIPLEVTKRYITSYRKSAALPIIDMMPPGKSANIVTERDYDPRTDSGLIRLSDFFNFRQVDPHLADLVYELFVKGVSITPQNSDPMAKKLYEDIYGKVMSWIDQSGPTDIILPIAPVLKIDNFWQNDGRKGGSNNRANIDLTFSRLQGRDDDPRHLRTILPSLFRQQVYLTVDSTTRGVGLWILRVTPPSKFSEFDVAQRIVDGRPLTGGPNGRPLRKMTFRDAGSGKLLSLLESRDSGHDGQARVRTTVGPGFSIHKPDGRLVTIPDQELYEVNGEEAEQYYVFAKT